MANRDDRFQKLLNDLRRQVVDAYAPGERLPSKREWASTYGIGPTTLQRALKCLNKQGLVRPSGRVGWFRSSCQDTTTRPPAILAKKHALRVAILSRLSRSEWNQFEIYKALLNEARHRNVQVVEVPNPHRERPTPGRARINLSCVPWNKFDVGLLVETEDTIIRNYSFLKRHRVLAVDLDATKFGIDSVAFNDMEVGALVARYFHSLGHTRFAVTEEFNVAGMCWDPNCTARRLGFEMAVGELGGVLIPDWRLLVARRVFGNPSNFIVPTIARWATSPPKERPTALFVTQGSVGTYVEELARKHICVPRDISIVSTWMSSTVNLVVSDLRVTVVALDLPGLSRRAFNVAAELAVEKHSVRAPRIFYAPARIIPGQTTDSPRA